MDILGVCKPNQDRPMSIVHIVSFAGKMTYVTLRDQHSLNGYCNNEP